MLGRLIGKLSLRRRRPGFHSPFGGTWPDRPDALERVGRKLAGGEIDAGEAERLHFWIANGYVILPGAVPASLVDELVREVAGYWERGDATIRIELGGTYHELAPHLRTRRYKLLDQYVRSELARRAAFAPAIRRFLELVFERDVLLFQGLTFEHGSGDPVHRDTVSVVVSSPMEFAAAWIALEDIRPETGELQYYPGSHRSPEFLFRGGYLNWNREKDGPEVYARYLADLHDKARAMGLELEPFLPKKGDALIWHAALAHGGRDFTDPEATRRSLVCHYCPLGVRPYYFAYLPERRRVVEHEPGCWYASKHYELAPTRSSGPLP